MLYIQVCFFGAVSFSCSTCVLGTSILQSLPHCVLALNKCPGVRPIGICEVARRIISKAIIFVVKDDIQEAAGSHQLCGGQIAAARQLFAILLVDASNKR